MKRCKMTDFAESNVTAEKLLADDKFELGGVMYQIEDAIANPGNADFPEYPDRTNISFFPLEKTTDRHSLMIVPSDMPFKIYNQK